MIIKIISSTQGQVARLKEHIERYQEDMKNLQSKEYVATDKAKKTDRQLRDAKDELSRLTLKECEAQGRRVNLEKQLESADLEISTLKVLYILWIEQSFDCETRRNMLHC